MTTDSERLLFSLAEELWGKATQLDKLLEEMAELQQVVLKIRAAQFVLTPAHKEWLTEEYCHVRLMLDQIQNIFDIDDSDERRRSLQKLATLILQSTGRMK